MTVIATASNPRFTSRRVDIDRGGPTYTIDTLRDLHGSVPDAELYFITGADALAEIFTWRDAEELFELAQFVGCTRPGYAMDADDARPDPGRPGHDGRDPGAGDLLHRLPRRTMRGRAGLVPRARRRRPVHRQAPPLPAPARPARAPKACMTATDHALELVHAAARAASDKLAQHIIAFDVSEQLAITDAFLLASATNDRQVKAIVDEVEDKLREIGAKPIRREGERDGRWVLIDYGDIVVHVQHEEERQFYALERLWRDCPVIELPADVIRRALTDRCAETPHPGPGPARRDRLERRGPRPGAADVAARRHRPRPGRRRSRRCSPRFGPARLWSSDLPARRQTADVRRGGDRAAPSSPTPRLREYDVGERSGLTLASSPATFPEEYAALARRGPVAPWCRARRRPPRCATGWCPRCATASPSLEPGETGIVVLHGACLKVGADGRCSAGRGSWRGRCTGSRTAARRARPSTRSAAACGCTSYNEKAVGSPARTRFRNRRAGWLRFRELPAGPSPGSDPGLWRSW